MSKEIIVPEGEDGDEAVKDLLPTIWKMAEGERHDENLQE